MTCRLLFSYIGTRVLCALFGQKNSIRLPNPFCQTVRGLLLRRFRFKPSFRPAFRACEARGPAKAEELGAADPWEEELAGIGSTPAKGGRDREEACRTLPTRGCSSKPEEQLFMRHSWAAFQLPASDFEKRPVCNDRGTAAAGPTARQLLPAAAAAAERPRHKPTGLRETSAMMRCC